MMDSQDYNDLKTGPFEPAREKTSGRTDAIGKFVSIATGDPS